MGWAKGLGPSLRLRHRHITVRMLLCNTLNLITIKHLSPRPSSICFMLLLHIHIELKGLANDNNYGELAGQL